MTTLVVGASGATGRLLVEQLLDQGEMVKIIIRSVDYLPDAMINNNQLIITESNLLEMTDAELKAHVQDCNAVISCLGHNLTFNGMFGHPRRLVKNSVMRLCKAIEATMPNTPVKFILMNTTGNQNLEAGEVVPMSQSIAVALIRRLLPPHADNEAAADVLQVNYGGNHSKVEWVVVRPDSLINDELVTDYEVFPSPIRNAIFDAGTTSRINVANFMLRLIVDQALWKAWSGQMPVIYNTHG